MVIYNSGTDSVPVSKTSIFARTSSRTLSTIQVEIIVDLNPSPSPWTFVDIFCDPLPAQPLLFSPVTTKGVRQSHIFTFYVIFMFKKLLSRTLSPIFLRTLQIFRGH